MISIRSRFAALAGALTFIAPIGCGNGESRFISVRTSTVPAPASSVFAPIEVGTAPVAVAVGPRSVWVANQGDGTVTEVGVKVRRAKGKPIKVGAGPLAIAVAGERVWVATGAGRIVGINAASRRIVTSPVIVPAPGGIAVIGSELWVTSRSAGTVRRLNARTGASQGKPIKVGDRPTDIAAAAGSVWVANSAAGTVSRIGQADGRVQATIRVASGQVFALASGPAGLWLVKTDDDQAARIEAARIDPERDALDTKQVRVPAGIPKDIAVGSEAVWVTDQGTQLPGSPPREPALLRIDPSVHALAGRPTRVGGQPVAVAVGQRAVWVANAGANSITAVVPGG